MALRRVSLPEGTKGSLWLSSMPGRFESWPAFEAEAERTKLSLVVCLTPRTEMQELSPRYHAAISEGALPFRWQHLPLRNFGVPQDRSAFRQAIDRIAQAVREGDAVMLHCAAGMGRTGSAAACVLKSLGLTTSEALQLVEQAGSDPQNAAQEGFVDWF